MDPESNSPLQTLIELAQLYIGLQNPSMAEEMLKRALEGNTESFGADHFVLLNIQNDARKQTGCFNSPSSARRYGVDLWT